MRDFTAAAALWLLPASLYARFRSFHQSGVQVPCRRML